MWIEIKKITNDSIEFEYDFYYDSIGWTISSGEVKERKQYKSNGIQVRNLTKSEGGVKFNLLQGESATPYLYLDKYGGVTFDGMWYNADDSYVFYYDDGDGYKTRIKHGVWPQTCKIEDYPIIDYSKENSNYVSKTYDLYGQYQILNAEVSLSKYASVGSAGSIKIVGDGRVVHTVQGSFFNQAGEVKKIEVDVTGIRELTIFYCREYVEYKFGGIGWELTNDEPVIGIEKISLKREIKNELHPVK